MAEMNLNDMELKWDTCLTVLIHFVRKAQQKVNGSSYKIAEAAVLYRATSFLTGERKDPDLTEDQCVRLLVNGVHAGQLHGAYSLDEAGLLGLKFLPYIEEESKKRNVSASQTSIKEV
jgi:hypothetical protein